MQTLDGFPRFVIIIHVYLLPSSGGWRKEKKKKEKSSYTGKESRAPRTTFEYKLILASDIMRNNYWLIRRGRINRMRRCLNVLRARSLFSVDVHNKISPLLWTRERGSDEFWTGLRAEEEIARGLSTVEGLGIALNKVPSRIHKRRARRRKWYAAAAKYYDRSHCVEWWEYLWKNQLGALEIGRNLLECKSPSNSADSKFLGRPMTENFRLIESMLRAFFRGTMYIKIASYFA